MLVNFHLPEDAFSAPAKTKFTGGSWKDRLTARKSAEWGRKKALERLAAGNAEPGAPQNRTSEPPTKRIKQSTTAPASKSFSGDVISSLFTYNPTSTVAKEPAPTEPVEDGDVAPSNAPLDDELNTFTSLGLSAPLASHLLRKMEIKAPTAIQRQAITQLCREDTDAFIQAQTGSGKTLAYLLPIVERITAISKKMKANGEDFSRHSGLFAIVLAPTRELSKQISTVLEGILSCCHWIVEGTVIGGEKKKSEKARLRKGLNILVATPGRLADHLNTTEVLDVSKVRWLVLDEGDRLMELGFEQDIQKIVSILNLRSRAPQAKAIPGLPERRTTVLCSATLKASVEQLQHISLKNPVSIAVDPEDLAEGKVDNELAAFSAPSQLKQSYAIVPAKQRLVTLVAILKQTFKRKGSVMKCIIFISCADSVDFHFELLSQEGKAKGEQDENEPPESPAKPKQTKVAKTPGKIPQGNTISEARTQGLATAISSKENAVQLFRLHGSLQQATRTSTLKAFAECADASVLICTDVASRGLDLPNIDLVIEYDPPFSKEDHLHRIGRTARAGRDGRALIFLQPGCEEGYVSILKKGKPRNLTRHDADELLKKGFAPTSGVVGTSNNRLWEDAATDFQLDVERRALENPKLLEQARRAYQSHVRAYATHVAAERSIFDMKELHLGHLAKAFALRDKPGAIRVPGLRPGKDAQGKAKGERKDAAKKRAGGAAEGTGSAATSGKKRGLDDVEETDAKEARRKMFAKMKAMGGASEFNLG